MAKVAAMTEGTIYLLKMCDTTGKIIYKVGKSKNFDKRFNNYNYCDILTLVKSVDIDNDEKAIIACFNENFTLDKGKEYFTHPDEVEVMAKFMTYFHHKNETASIKFEYSTADKQYNEYKSSILGNTTPNRTDPFCDYYYLSNDQVKRLLKIKRYGLNLKIDESHVNNMVDDLLASENPVLYGHIGIIEYNQYKTDSVECLLELIDGHHRIECLKRVFAKRPNISLSLWVGLHKSDNPTSQATHLIFKRYNLLKPFIVDINISELSGQIINQLNERFTNDTGFTLIKDHEFVIRPSIKKTTFNTHLQKKLEMMKTKSVHIQVNQIVDLFKAHNDLFSKQKFDWFNSYDNTFFRNKKKITQPMFEKALANKCWLGIVEIESLINEVFRNYL